MNSTTLFLGILIVTCGVGMWGRGDEIYGAFGVVLGLLAICTGSTADS